MSGFAPAGLLPAFVLPEDAAEGALAVRPALALGPQPGAVVILVDVAVQGGDE